jgi:hypothetical protein
MTSVKENVLNIEGQAELVLPSLVYLPSYVQALESGWSPNNVRPEARFDELAMIEQDAAKFVAGLVDLDATGGDIQLPDGSTVPKLPGYRKMAS